MRRVAFLCYHSCPTAKLGEKDAGGMNVYVRNLSGALSKLGLQIDVFSRIHDESLTTEDLMLGNARLIHINAGPSNSTKDQLHNYLPEFAENIQHFADTNQLKYDLIHSHYWLSANVGLTLSRKWNIPHVTTFHTLEMIKRMARDGEYPMTLREESEERIVRSDVKIIASHSHEKDFLTHYYEASQNQVEIIPCGVDQHLFKPFNQCKAREALGITRPFMLLSVGRTDPGKGVDLLLEAVNLMDRAKDIEIFVVGDNSTYYPEAQKLKDLAVHLGLTNQVRFVGVVPQENLHLYYNAADALVMPSYSESFGLAALEAMACGTPVVASRVGGLPALVKDGVSGYLVPWHRPASFAEKIEIILANPSLAREMGKAAFLLSEGRSWEKMAGKVMDVYQATVETNSSIHKRRVYEKH